MKRAAINKHQPTHSFRNTTKESQLTSRGGAISAMVLVVLLILSSVLASQVKRVLAERRQCRNELDYLQTERLADAGLLLANEQLHQDPNWTGTTWELPAGIIDQTKSGRVSIVVSRTMASADASMNSDASSEDGNLVTNKPGLSDDERQLPSPDGGPEIRVVALYPANVQTPYQVTRTRRWSNE